MRQRQVVADSAGALVSHAFRQTAELVRKEMVLTRAEMTRKGKCYGTGGSLFPAVGVLGLFTAQALLATCIAALALVLPVGVAAFAITGTLAAAGAVTALAGKRQIALR
ncbi:hypothetical protein GCM10010343_13380 [Streptomyces avidinii]|nr:hypothetical protein GCM10010343_13380 [Streptomyces avidinii]